MMRQRERKPRIFSHDADEAGPSGRSGPSRSSSGGCPPPSPFPRLRRWASFLCLAAWGLLALPVPALARSLDAVVLQLKWTHAFQFAGYYAATEKGYYREAGLDVRIREAGPGTDAIGEVLAGRAQFGVATSDLLPARAAGKPLVVLAAIFQHSPLALALRGGRPPREARDLIGRRVMLDSQSEELLAYLKREGVPPDRIVRVPHSFGVEDLASGRVAALAVYTTCEPYYLNLRRIPYRLLIPRSAGIDFYGNCLFTSEAELRANPERVEAFRAASLRGWRYALAHPEEIIGLILSRYSRAHSRDFYRFEARRTIPLLDPDLVDIGYMSPSRWRHIASVYAELGRISPDVSLEGFLYEPPVVGPDRTWLFLSLAAALGGLVLLGAAVFAFERVNRKLKRHIDERRRIEEALRESEERYRLLADVTFEGIVVHQDGIALDVNSAFSRIMGYSREEILGKDVLALTIHPEDLSIVARQMERDQGPPYEIRSVRRDGTAFPVEVEARTMTLGGRRVRVAAIRDISERKQIEERIRHMARHDPLTDLPNRALFSELLGRALALARRNRTRLALMFLDLDRFKPVNDTWGHAVGDLLLQEAARRMRAALRASDTVGRIGGDEFVILLPLVAEPEDALTAAEKLRAALERPFEIGGRSLRISCSVGVALFPDQGADEIGLAHHADQAMYWAKQAGGNRVVLFRAERAGENGDVAPEGREG